MFTMNFDNFKKNSHVHVQANILPMQLAPSQLATGGSQGISIMVSHTTANKNVDVGVCLGTKPIWSSIAKIPKILEIPVVEKTKSLLKLK